DSTLDMYRQALVNLALYFQQALDADVLICMANRGDPNNAGAIAEYNDKFIPARVQALAELAGNPRIHAGSDLVEALGQMPRASYGPTDRPTNNSPALFNEGGVYVHMNDAAIRKAAKAEADAMLAVIDPA